MKRWHRAALACLFVSGPAASAPKVQEGFWESLIRIDSERGVFPIPAFKTGKCVTLDNLIPNSVQSPERCRVYDQRVAGDDVTWRVRCQDDKGGMEGFGRITYAGKTYKGAMDVVFKEKAKGREFKMRYVMEGGWTRACKPGDKR